MFSDRDTEFLSAGCSCMHVVCKHKPHLYAETDFSIDKTFNQNRQLDIF